VALGWLWGAYRLAINRLWNGFDVAFRWLWDRFTVPFLFSAFCFLLSRPPGLSTVRQRRVSGECPVRLASCSAPSPGDFAFATDAGGVPVQRSAPVLGRSNKRLLRPCPLWVPSRRGGTAPEDGRTPGLDRYPEVGVSKYWASFSLTIALSHRFASVIPPGSGMRDFHAFALLRLGTG
jgi:hypothetical protein